MKMSPGTLAERESSGFCSGEELDDPDTDSRSTSDVESRDKIIKIEHTSPNNKRKHHDKSDQHESVKRICYEDKPKSSSPFRPWSDTKDPPLIVRSHFPIYQEEPLSLVKEKKKSPDQEVPLDFRKKVFPFKSKPMKSELYRNNTSDELFRTDFNRIDLSKNELIRNEQPNRIETNIDHFSIINSYRTKQLVSPFNIDHTNQCIANQFRTVSLNSSSLHNHSILRHPIKIEDTAISNHSIKLERDSILLEEDIKQELTEPNKITNDKYFHRKIEKPKPIYTKNINRDLSDSCSSNSSASYSDSLPNMYIKTEDKLNSPNSLDRPDNQSITNESNSNYCKKSTSSSSSSQHNHRNYKNMTRERRIEANARERTRVHTISAAFETLRKTVPAYSNNQKLSKLAVLRIACSYIMMLGRIAGHDYSADQSEPTVESCMEEITKTIQMEGKVKKKRRDEIDGEDSS